jgi:glycosyltransferase involved in cell wall biosynthesis
MYFHGHSVGGTNPSLLEAMAAGSRIIAHNNEFNRSILGSESLYFDEIEDLSQIIKNTHKLLSSLDKFKLLNIKKIKTNYKWEHIAKEYEIFFLRVISK